MHKYAATSLKSSYEALESIVLAMSDQLISGSTLQSLGGGTAWLNSFWVMSGVLGAHAKKNAEQKRVGKNVNFFVLKMCNIYSSLTVLKKRYNVENCFYLLIAFLCSFTQYFVVNKIKCLK